jgi:hypothetical protein
MAKSSRRKHRADRKIPPSRGADRNSVVAATVVPKGGSIPAARALRTLNLFVLAIFGISMLYIRFGLDWRALESLPNSVKIIYMLLMISALFFQEIIFRSLRSQQTTSIFENQYQYNLVVWNLLFSVVVLILTISPFLYIVGYTHKIASFIGILFPKLQVGVIQILSWLTTLATSSIIGIIITGVLSNFLTDGLKNLYKSWKMSKR